MKNEAFAIGSMSRADIKRLEREAREMPDNSVTSETKHRVFAHRTFTREQLVRQIAFLMMFDDRHEFTMNDPELVEDVQEEMDRICEIMDQPITLPFPRTQ